MLWSQATPRSLTVVVFRALCLSSPLPSTTLYLSQGIGDAVVMKADSEQVNQPTNTWFQLATCVWGEEQSAEESGPGRGAGSTFGLVVREAILERGHRSRG